MTLSDNAPKYHTIEGYLFEISGEKIANSF